MLFEILKANGFSKSERIVSQKLIDKLFTSGQSHSLTAFPLRAVFLQHPMPVNQILVSVSKRRFKHAVDRNRVKRQIREAYRLHKDILSQHGCADIRLAIAFIWISNKHLPSAHVEKSVVGLLQRIASRMRTSNPSIVNP